MQGPAGGWRAVTAASVLLCACGSGPKSAASPLEQCSEFVDAWCGKQAECVAPSDRARSTKDCEFSFEVYEPCEEISGVARSLDDCLGAVSALDCQGYDPSKGLQMPEPCHGLFTVSQ